MTILDTVITLVILLGIGYLIYTRLKNQDLRDTFDEIKNLFSRKGGME